MRTVGDLEPLGSCGTSRSWTPLAIPVPPRNLPAAVLEIGVKRAAKGFDLATKPSSRITLSHTLNPPRDARAREGKGEIQWCV